MSKFLHRFWKFSLIISSHKLSATFYLSFYWTWCYLIVNIGFLHSFFSFFVYLCSSLTKYFQRSYHLLHRFFLLVDPFSYWCYGIFHFIHCILQLQDFSLILLSFLALLNLLFCSRIVFLLSLDYLSVFSCDLLFSLKYLFWIL